MLVMVESKMEAWQELLCGEGEMVGYMNVSGRESDR